MLDFPTPTSIGQVYTGTNGVTYIWTGTLWLASGASAGGDVYAKNSTGFGIGTSETVVSFNTIVTGNSGNWYNTSNGRFTPPAGRYFIRVQMIGSQSAITTIYSIIRKNGVAIVSAPATTGGASHSMEPAVDGIFDANGTDYFEAACQASASAVSVNGFFVAFPISGIKGPPGDPPTAQSIMLYHSAASVSVNATAATMAWDTVGYNSTGGTYSAGTFTVPSGLAGVWDINVTAQGINATGTPYLVFMLMVNGVEIAEFVGIINANAVTSTMAGRFVLAAGDAVRVQFLSVAGTTVPCTTSGIRKSWMHLTRVGA